MTLISFITARSLRHHQSLLSAGFIFLCFIKDLSQNTQNAEPLPYLYYNTPRWMKILEF